MPEKLRVVIVDDHPLLRAGVIRALSRRGFEIVAEGACAEDALRLTEAMQPDLVLLDVSMEGDGIEAARSIARCHPQVKIVMLTVCETSDCVLAAVRAGAHGYVLKGVAAPELARTVRAIHRGEKVLPAHAASGDTSDTPAEVQLAGERLQTLSDRDKKILLQVAQGLSNREIGNLLDLDEATVRRQMTGIMRALNVSSRIKAALIAQRLLEHQSF